MIAAVRLELLPSARLRIPTDASGIAPAPSALAQAVTDQMQHGRTTLIEALINQELGEPFRRDAMKKPVEVAGIDPADMHPQTV